jgi:hypothetical protein
MMCIASTRDNSLLQVIICQLLDECHSQFLILPAETTDYTIYKNYVYTETSHLSAYNLENAWNEPGGRVEATSSL